MKKIFRIIGMTVMVSLLFAFPTFAATKTIATAAFTVYDMTYYDEGLKWWSICENSVSDTKAEEYGCYHSQYGMGVSKNYAAVRSYEMQTDADFSFKGTMSLTTRDPAALAKGQVDFFVCTSKGNIIYPSDGSQYQSVKQSDGVITISGEAKHLVAGDRIYFVAMNHTTEEAQWLQFAESIYETEYNAAKGVPFTNTNAYSGKQGDEGWSFMCTKTTDVTFGTTEVEVAEVEDTTSTTKVASRYPEDSGIVISNADKIVDYPKLEDAQEPIYKMQLTVTMITLTATFLLIAQVFWVEALKKKRSDYGKDK